MTGVAGDVAATATATYSGETPQARATRAISFSASVYQPRPCAPARAASRIRRRRVRRRGVFSSARGATRTHEVLHVGLAALRAQRVDHFR